MDFDNKSVNSIFDEVKRITFVKRYCKEKILDRIREMK